MQLDSIAALATAPGEGGIAIVRISGESALRALQTVFRDKHGRPRQTFVARRLYLGYIVSETGDIIDQALVSYMPGPFSYTGEDIVEINVHGGALVTQEVLALVLQPELKVRLAKPGEFTERAFINGKLDLVQAEAVIDLIQAKSKAALNQAGRHLRGELSVRVRQLRDSVVELLAQVAASIDFPEHDIPQLTERQMLDGIEAALSEINNLLATSFAGRVLREGLRVAIVGRPNVGKSSLLNALVGKERAIVTDIAGTTRDVIEEYYLVNGVPLVLLDTAGMRQTADPVEKIGVALAEQTMQEADLVLVILDQGQPLAQSDRDTLAAAASNKCFVVCNKADLASRLTASDWQLLADQTVFHVSALTGKGLPELREAMAALVTGGIIQPESPFVANVRQEGLLRESAAALAAAKETVSSGWPLDMVQIDLQTAFDRLGEMLGLQASASLAQEIFGRFCIGK